MPRTSNLNATELNITIVHGSNLDVLPTLPDCSIDSIVTDPPYELGFMGKRWDASGIAYNVTLWTECLRVLKPGGHLLAFGGTRTYHRMACAIEDAGFEIRDSIHWMYGSGFPKSLDVSKAIDKQRHDWADIYRVTAWVREVRDRAGLTNKDIDAAFGTNGMAGHWTSSKSQPAILTIEQVPTLLQVLGVGADDVPEDIRRLLWDLNDRKGQPGENWWKREVIGTKTAGIANPDDVDRHTIGASKSVVVDITAAATDEARTWEGWGTALKPAHEPIVVARKPLNGTVANNVLTYGTGALNIDATRIAGDTGSGNWAGKTKARGYEGGWDSTAKPNVDQNQLGRWPANVVLSHLEDCRQVGTHQDTFGGGAKATSGFVDGYAHDGFTGRTIETGVWECAPGCAVAELDRQSGKRPGGQYPTKRGQSVSTAFASGQVTEGGPRAMPGVPGASAYFYCAKPSRRERNAGLDDLPDRELDDHVGQLAGKTGSGNDRSYTVKNNHPTVKPLALMRYLVRLVTPPGGTVLEPFAGSGTTLMAAILEGFHAVGVEMTEEYLPIIEGRVAWAREQAEVEAAAAAARAETDQGSLFDS